jgi:hypothetical protein
MASRILQYGTGEYGVAFQATSALRRCIGLSWTQPGQILTNDLYGDPNIRRRQTTAPQELQ